MRNTSVVLLAALLFSSVSFARDDKDTSGAEIMRVLKFIDSVNSAMHYERGNVILNDNVATLKIPAGFKFLNATQAQYVLADIWKNPKRTDVLGMVFPESGGPYADSSYAFIVSYDASGHVKDDDADEIDYDAMLKEMQESEADVNKERAAQGYESIHMVGWAQKPYYDQQRKVLHWAKEFKFGDEEANTLNYDVRILGRKGILSLNAVAGIDGLPLVKKDIEKILTMPEFTAGNKYSDFNSSTDNVAAYTIGGLVAGKILAKVGFFALVLKFWKLIAAGIMGVGYAIKKFFKKKNDDFETPTEEPVTDVTA
jgi:uncharacterized membrane-anchored protein